MYPNTFFVAQLINASDGCLITKYLNVFDDLQISWCSVTQTQFSYMSVESIGVIKQT